jgi:hemoglobin
MVPRVAVDPVPDPSASQPQTVFDLVGGSFFIDLVEEFYRGVEADPVLRPSYPDDLSESKRTLAWFLIQYWGGPTDYSDERGHPRLRMRHVPFVIGRRERDRWLLHMMAAVEGSEAPDEVKALLGEYFDKASTAMINQVD